MVKYPHIQKNAQRSVKVRIPRFGFRVARPLNNRMLLRVVIIYCVLTTVACAFHEHTYAVWELREDLQIRMMNLWELFQQLEYVDPHHYTSNHIDCALGRAILRA